MNQNSLWSHLHLQLLCDCRSVNVQPFLHKSSMTHTWKVKVCQCCVVEKNPHLHSDVFSLSWAAEHTGHCPHCGAVTQVWLDITFSGPTSDTLNSWPQERWDRPTEMSGDGLKHGGKKPGLVVVVVLFELHTRGQRGHCWQWTRKPKDFKNDLWFHSTCPKNMNLCHVVALHGQVSTCKN